MSDKQQAGMDAETDQGQRSLPEGWVWARLGDLADYVNGRAFKSSEWEEQGRPIVRIQDLTGSGATVNRYSGAVEDKHLIHDGDFLISWSATLGAYIYRGEEAILNQHIFKVQPHISKLYLYYLITAYLRDLEQKVHGSGMQHITKSKFEESAVPLAPTGQQHRIVDAIETQFTRLDAAVEALERAMANLERYRASVLQAACEGRLVPTEAELARREGRDYEPAEELLERILEERREKWEEERWEYEIERAKKKAAQAERKAAGLPYYIRELEPEHWEDRTKEEYEPYLPEGEEWKERYDEPEAPDTEDLPELPEGWCWASLDQMTWQSGYGTSQKCRYGAQGPPVLRIPNIVDGGFDLSDLKMATEPDELDHSDILEPGDLLVVRTNGSRDLIGKVGYVRQAFNRPHFFASYLIRYRTVLAGEWLAAIWDSSTMRQELETRAATSAGQYNLSLSRLDPLPIPLPPSAEQRRIVEEVERRLSVVQALEDSAEADLARARRLRQAILKKAFEGRLVDQDPNDEPASQLLERIRKQGAGPGGDDSAAAKQTEMF